MSKYDRNETLKSNMIITIEGHTACKLEVATKRKGSHCMKLSIQRKLLDICTNVGIAEKIL